jgi:DNA polymerase III epsilon subunit-like protein
MNNYIVVWDVETTGLNSKEDFIIQLAALKFKKSDNSFKDGKKWYIKPAHDFTISPKAQETHGLSKEFILENGVYFRDIAQEFFNMINDADLLTYNGNSFDIKFLNEECKRWGLELPITGKKFYDAFAMECRFNPRDLSSVYKKYTGKELDGAHDAFNDVKATAVVFLEQMKTQGLTYADIDEFQENNLLTPDGTIRNAAAPGEDIRIVFAVGKYRDSEFMEVSKKDPSYIKWYMENLAADYTKKVLKEYYAKNR